MRLTTTIKKPPLMGGFLEVRSWNSVARRRAPGEEGAHALAKRRAWPIWLGGSHSITRGFARGRVIDGHPICARTGLAASRGLRRCRGSGHPAVDPAKLCPHPGILLA